MHDVCTQSSFAMWRMAMLNFCTVHRQKWSACFVFCYQIIKETENIYIIHILHTLLEIHSFPIWNTVSHSVC